MKITFNKIVIAGLGLIGGSFYKAAQKAGYHVTGLHQNETNGLDEADLIIIAMPEEAIVPWIEQYSALFKPGSVVIDVCGVKDPIVKALAHTKNSAWTFVGAHPMAGREKSGWENATADLFQNASMILTPDENLAPTILDTLKAFFASIGFARSVITTPQHHDKVIAFTSQLGHVIASAYAQDALVHEANGYAAGSYANMTRIATMDPVGWSALFLANRENLLSVLNNFIVRLETFHRALADENRNALETFIKCGSDNLSYAQKDTSHA